MVPQVVQQIFEKKAKDDLSGKKHEKIMFFHVFLWQHFGEI